MVQHSMSWKQWEQFIWQWLKNGEEQNSNICKKHRASKKGSKNNFHKRRSLDKNMIGSDTTWAATTTWEIMETFFEYMKLYIDKTAHEATDRTLLPENEVENTRHVEKWYQPVS